ncbi:chaperone protein ClpB4, mitochondrial [Tanacetum coccineum]
MATSTDSKGWRGGGGGMGMWVTLKPHFHIKRPDDEMQSDFSAAYLIGYGSLLVGAKFRGGFEEQFKDVPKEFTVSNGQIILFIYEIHTVVGAGE